MRKGRPIKTRLIQQEPKTKQFSPRGKAGRPGHSELKHEEFEAIRLNDHLGLRQDESARFMKVSQQTFSRILTRARKAVAEALVTGKIIKVDGGNFKIVFKR